MIQVFQKISFILCCAVFIEFILNNFYRESFVGLVMSNGKYFSVSANSKPATHMKMIVYNRWQIVLNDKNCFVLKYPTFSGIENRNNVTIFQYSNIL